MKFLKRRSNADRQERKGMSAGKIAALGSIAALFLVALIGCLASSDPTSILNLSSRNSNYTVTLTPEEEERYMEFANRILMGTGTVWRQQFDNAGLTYQEPKMVVYTGSITSGCGESGSSIGPFYCSADQTIYLDLTFFRQIEKEVREGNYFAYAYVIAHEVGHHVQNLLGSLPDVQMKVATLPKDEASELNIRNELQADYYAGVWAHHDSNILQQMETSDIDEGLEAVAKIGKEYQNLESRGFSVQDPFNHGTHELRSKWLKKGIIIGKFLHGDTFSPPYNYL